MTARYGTPKPLDLSLRRLRGVVYVNAAGCMDDQSGSALLRVVPPLLTGTSFRRVIVDLCDVDGVDRFGWDAIEQLRTMAEAHDRQLAVLTSTHRRDELFASQLRHRTYGRRAVAGSSSCRSYATADLRAS
jgi:anti-anti-sigma regulatory factor